MISIFKTSQDFENGLSIINNALTVNKGTKKTTTLITNKLTTEQKKHGFLNGLKVTLLSLFRVFCYDQFSHVRINNVAKALLKEVEVHCKNGTMNDKIMVQLKRTATLLAFNSKKKHLTLMAKTYKAMAQMYGASTKQLAEKKQQEKEIADFHENGLFKK